MEYQETDSDINPVTNLQKQWRVLTFHEDRLNRLDEHLKHNNDNSVSATVDNSVMENEIRQLSLMQNNLNTSLNDSVKSLTDHIKSLEAKISNIERTSGDDNVSE
jgi:chromosome segregation ATPase